MNKKHLPSFNNRVEMLSFSFQECYLSRKLIKNRAELIEYIKKLAIIHGIAKPSEIIFNHDLEDSDYNGVEFKDNFKFKGSYDYLKEALK